MPLLEDLGPLETLNVDQVQIAEDMNDYIGEIVLCQSANGNRFKEADKNRIRSYLSALRFALDEAATEPEMDVPKTNPMPMAISKTKEVKDVQNTSVKHVATLLWLAREEFMRSGTAAESSGILPADKLRQEQMYDKIERYLANYVDKATPQDMPETRPSKAIQGKGSVKPIIRD